MNSPDIFLAETGCKPGKIRFKNLFVSARHQSNFNLKDSSTYKPDKNRSRSLRRYFFDSKLGKLTFDKIPGGFSKSRASFTAFSDG